MIPNHPGQPGGRLGTKQDAQNILTLMQEASAEIKKQAQEGKCWDAVEKEFKLPNYANWPGYENGLPFIARRYCALWVAAPERRSNHFDTTPTLMAWETKVSRTIDFALSIDTTLRIGAACYLLVAAPAVLLVFAGARPSPAVLRSPHTSKAANV